MDDVPSYVMSAGDGRPTMRRIHCRFQLAGRKFRAISPRSPTSGAVVTRFDPGILYRIAQNEAALFLLGRQGMFQFCRAVPVRG